MGKKYYDIRDDMKLYPDAIIYNVWSMRSTGKTYSFLRMCIEDDIKFAYIKRTNEDVKLVCENKEVADDVERFETSPFVPLNRDFNFGIVTALIEDGIGCVYRSVDGNATGSPIGYVLSLNKVKGIKGIDLSVVDYICLDEYIPLTHEIVRRTEGDAFFDLIRTISRDRVTRGRPPIKVFMFANAENIACPIVYSLEVMDEMAILTNSDNTHLYIEDRRILLHHIKEHEASVISDSMKDGLYDVMAGTLWAEKSYKGMFTNNDFSNVKKVNLKKYKPLLHIYYRTKDFYIYFRENTGEFYTTRTPFNKEIKTYDLRLENDQKEFYLNELFVLKEATIEGRMSFELYSHYDLIVNYKKIFKV